MAVAKSIREAITALNAELCAFESTLQMVDAAAGDDTPPWYYVFRKLEEAISERSEALETLLTQKALPLLQDFEAVSTATA